ncbi:L-xylulose reductase [Leptopilina heterotoma]|uniref:L-xylulose reductase n=1 Tax=Leptopilina heterotoma TaxID=63436 RepID=UPI001CA87079|nr:L-xylulose reductase [Leptopilina heterotoma]
MNINFEGKRILVTGAGQGIGKELSKRLSNCKATVIALSKTQKHLDNLKAENPKIETICADLKDWNATRRIVQSVLPIDLLVNNAGVALLKPFLEATSEDFDLTFDVNVKAVMNISQIVAKDLIQRKMPGSIVNLSSQASEAALKNHTVYCASKGALQMLTRNMALELGPHKIRVNSVNPTVVLTEMGRLGWSNPEKAQEMLHKIPLGRFAEVDEVVDAVVFLLSDFSSMINGIALPVDGGFLST